MPNFIANNISSQPKMPPMFDKKRFLVTSALPYANGPLHIGHLAGAYLPADIYVNYLRLIGKDVVFVCGSDEHGAAITTKALKEGIKPKQIIDKYHEMFKTTFENIGISFDYYDRTSAKHHHKVSQDFFLKLYEKDALIKKETEQYFDQKMHMFLADRYIKGTCPHCAYQEAYGDQCESCGTSLSPMELKNPVSTLSGEKPILRKTIHWYLPLDRHETFLKNWLTKGLIKGKVHHDTNLWKAHVIGQCKSWLDGGLRARAMTRDLNWGVDVPESVPGAKGKKLYVWLDAPIGYISATMKWAESAGKNWKDYWQNEESALIHFIGKDNIVFHCLIFPVILKEYGTYNLPVNVPANQFLNLEGNKISTSRNWAIWVHQFVEDHPDWKDQLRFYLTKNMPEQRDSEFTWKGFQEVINTELVNNLSNFINRVLVLTQKYFDGSVPDFDPNLDLVPAEDEEGMSFHDAELLALFDLIDAACKSFDTFEFRAALQKTMEISTAGNQILQFNAPWKTIKSEPERTKLVLNLMLQYVTALSALIKPFMPFASKKLRAMLQLPEVEKAELLKIQNQLAEGNPLLPAGHKLSKHNYLFTKIEDEAIEKELKKLNSIVDSKPNSVDAKAPITFDDFLKLDMRIAQIIDAVPVPKTDKLMKITLKLSENEHRTVVSGIAHQYKPKDIIGQQVTLLANLSPRKIRGISSQGMILMAEDHNGKLSFLAPGEAVQEGSKVS